MDAALSRAMRPAIEHAMECENLRVRIAVVAGGNQGAVDRYFEEVVRRREACTMTEKAALESVYQDIISGRMR